MKDVELRAKESAGKSLRLCLGVEGRGRGGRRVKEG